MHVLIVEDDRDLLEALTGALEAHGCTVAGALTAGAARAFGDLDGFACVLLDLGLPDGSGLDLLVEWRRRKVTVPVIVVTARDAIGDRIAGLEQGADDHAWFHQRSLAPVDGEFDRELRAFAHALLPVITNADGEEQARDRLVAVLDHHRATAGRPEHAAPRPAPRT